MPEGHHDNPHGSQDEVLDKALSSYRPPAPPKDLAARIAAAAAQQDGAGAKPRRSPKKLALWVSGSAAAAATLVGWLSLSGPQDGDGLPREAIVVAGSGPRAVDLGSQGRALLEAGAEVEYRISESGSVVARQHAGSVLYRVTPPASFVVETEGGRAIVVGTEFRVEVSNMVQTKNGRRGNKKALLGAAAVTVAVTVYAGAVLLENEHGQVEAAAGQTAVARTDRAPALVEPGSSGTAPAGTPEGEGPRPPVETVKRLKTAAARAALLQAIGRARQARERASGGTTAPAHEPLTEATDEEPRGRLSADYIRETVRDVVPLIQDCYHLALDETPTAEGTMVVQFTIAGEEDVGGLVESAEVVDMDPSLATNPVLEECMLETVLSLEFSPPEGGGQVQVNYPFRFSVSNDEEPEGTPNED